MTSYDVHHIFILSNCSQVASLIDHRFDICLASLCTPSSNELLNRICLLIRGSMINVMFTLLSGFFLFTDYIVGGAVVGAVVLFLAVVAVLCCWLWKRYEGRYLDF